MKLYYSKGSCSLASHISLEEAGAKFETHRLDLRAGEQRSPEFLKINPKGKVPTLVLDDGTVITENPAIISFAADTHPASNLLPKPGDVARAKAQEWMAWCSSTVHPSIGVLFRVKDDNEKKAAAQASLDLYNQWLTGKKFVLGDQFSGADAYTLVFYLWATMFKLDVGSHMRASAKALLERPGVQRALATQELKFEI